MHLLMLIFGTVLLPKACTLVCYECIPGNIESLSSPNGTKCLRCDKQDCFKTVKCNENERYCFYGKVNALGAMAFGKGCATKDQCSNRQTIQIPNFFGDYMSCCLGDVCNSTSSPRASLLLLIFWVFSP
ncbi:unnamed protein product [Oreochromis niloticus]|nr:unnamed protein product [Mustela putorius furo]